MVIQFGEKPIPMQLYIYYILYMYNMYNINNNCYNYINMNYIKILMIQTCCFSNDFDFTYIS